MRWQMVDYRLLQIRFPEVIDTKTAFWVVAVSAILHMLIHLVAPSLPNGLIGIAAAIGIHDAWLDYFIAGAASSIQPPQMLDSCKPGYGSGYSSNVFKLWVSDQPPRRRRKNDAIWECMIEPIGKLRPILRKGMFDTRCIASVFQRSLQLSDLEQQRTVLLFCSLGAVFGDFDLGDVVIDLLAFICQLLFKTVNQRLGKRQKLSIRSLLFSKTIFAQTATCRSNGCEFNYVRAEAR